MEYHDGRPPIYTSEFVVKFPKWRSYEDDFLGKAALRLDFDLGLNLDASGNMISSRLSRMR